MVAEARHSEADDPLVDLLRRARPAESIVTEQAIAQTSAHMHAVMDEGSSIAPPHKHPSLADRYVLVRQLGAGATSWVYEAYDPELRRAVAVKLVRDETPFGTSGESRLYDEAQTLAQINHPNVVAVHDVGTYDRVAGLESDAGRGVFLVMELVRGVSLTEAVRETTGDWRRALELLLPAGDALAASHRAGVVHGDFKPDNVIVAEDGRVVLLDYGLGRLRRETDTDELSETVGTPAFMAPELFDGGASTPASDQFAYCVALYEAIHGRRPFTGGSLEELRDAVNRGPPRGTTRVPGWLDRAIRRGLGPEPSARFDSLEALIRELRGRAAFRRRAAGASALVGLGLAVGLAVMVPGATTDDCAPRADELDGVWDDAVRGRVRDAFDASGVAFAGESLAVVQRQLDTYADAWMERRESACEATQPGRQVAVRACLETRRAALAQVTRILGQADPAVVTHAAEVVAELPPVTGCADAALPVPDPAAPSTATAGALESDLARATALVTAGHLDEATALLKELLEAAERAEVHDVTAGALLQRARVEILRAKWPAAESSLYRALTAAERAGHVRHSIEAQLGLVEVLRKRNKASEAQRLLEVAGARLDLQDLGPALAAKRAHGQAMVEFHHSRLPAALAHAEEALRLYEAAYGPNSAQAIMALWDVAVFQGRLYDIQTSEASYASMQRRLEESLGRRHPLYGLALVGLAYTRMDTARPKEAVAYFEDALEVIEPVVGVVHEHAIWAYEGLGGALSQLGRHDEALEHLRHAVTVARQAYGNDHTQTGDALAHMCAVMSQQERYRESLDACRESRDILAATLGTEHQQTATAVNTYGAALVGVGKIDEGIALIREAHDVRVRLLPADHPHIGYSHFNMGKARLAQGDPAAAQKELTAAVEVWQQSYGPDHPEVARALLVLARAHSQQEDAKGAIDHTRRAVEILERKGNDPARLERARAALSELLRHRKPREQ